MNKPTDYFGNEIESGDIIAYATTSSSSAAMNHGQVLATRSSQDQYGKPYFSLTIHKIGMARFGSHMETVKTERAVTIHEVERCINLTKYTENSQAVKAPS